MERVVEAYHHLLKSIEALQAAGKFTLPEASGLFQSLVAIKGGIEEAHKTTNQAGAGMVSNDELDSVKIELMAKNIELDNLKRSYGAIVEKLEKLEETSAAEPAVLGGLD